MFVNLKRLKGYRSNVGKSKRHKGVYYTEMGLAYTLGSWFGYEVQRLSPNQLRELVMLDGDYVEVSGLADNEDQVVEKFKHLADREEKFVIEMHPVYRKDEPDTHGFRFHKWGSYIGDREITMEYLYDQTDMDVIYVFQIVPLLDGKKKTIFGRTKTFNVKKRLNGTKTRRDVKKITYKTYQKQ